MAAAMSMGLSFEGGQSQKVPTDAIFVARQTWRIRNAEVGWEDGRTGELESGECRVRGEK